MIVRSPQNGHRRGRSSSGISITAASVLFSVPGSTIKGTTAGVKVGPEPVHRVLGLHPPGKSMSNEKRILLSACRRTTVKLQPATLAGIFPNIGSYSDALRAEGGGLCGARKRARGCDAEYPQ